MWIVGLASGRRDIVIFPERIGVYPYDSLESVVWHEVVHLALSAQAGDQALPRWFHEGVAMSAEKGWGVTGRVQLLFAAGGSAGLADLERLFNSETQPESATAYLLARRAGVRPAATSRRQGARGNRRPRRAWCALRGGVRGGDGRDARRGCGAHVAHLPALDGLDSCRHQPLFAVDRHPGTSGRRFSGDAAQTIAAPASVGSGGGRGRAGHAAVTVHSLPAGCCSRDTHNHLIHSTVAPGRRSALAAR
jgi:hypothetical protein